MVLIVSRAQSDEFVPVISGYSKGSLSLEVDEGLIVNAGDYIEIRQEMVNGILILYHGQIIVLDK